MKTLVLCLMLLLFSGHSFAQSSTSPLRLEKKKVYQDDVLLKSKDVKEIVMSNPLSSAEFKSHQVSGAVTASLVTLGGCFCLYGAYLSLEEGKKANDEIENGNLNYQQDFTKSFTFLGVAVACIGVSIPFAVKTRKSLKKSIDLYNSGIKETGCNGIDLRMNLSFNQVGVTMRF